jgi:cytochrome o ubiquinol oxidase subunit 2
MKFDTKVVSGEGYAEWVNTTRTIPGILTKEKYKELAKQSKNNPVQIFSSVEDGLYDYVVMKYMAPGHIMKTDEVNASHDALEEMGDMHTH